MISTSSVLTQLAVLLSGSDLSAIQNDEQVEPTSGFGVSVEVKRTGALCPQETLRSLKSSHPELKEQTFNLGWRQGG
jgi:hypothetical protein